MDAKKALMILNQRIKEQCPDQWLYNKDVRRYRQMKWRHKKWEKALFKEISGPSLFNKMFSQTFKGVTWSQLKSARNGWEQTILRSKKI